MPLRGASNQAKRSLCGAANGERDVEELVALYRAGRIRPLVSARYMLDQTADALNALMQRKVQGKVVVVP